MKQSKKPMMRKICIISGVCLLLGAAVLLLSWQWSIASAEKRAEAFVSSIRASLPPTQGAVAEERRDNSMATLSVDGIDFVGILEMPRFGAALPVGAQWGRPSKYPCRFDGSIYTDTLKIGTASQRGQFDFYREISVGDSVFFTDMEGNRYGYAVSALHYAKSADQAALHREEAALTIFVQNQYAFEYLMIFCK